MHDAAAALGGDDAPYPQTRYVHVHIHVIHIILSVSAGNGAQRAILGRQLRQSLGLYAFQKRAAFIADPAADAPAVEFQILPLEAAVLELHVPGVFVHPGDQLALGIVGYRRAVHHEHKGQRGGA